ncbi:MAG: hypothetical protein DRN15_05140 [Thermoprotei archaeon]|nr:MAG: hypothetical protein DRN15_05140 [Thermoprotei archaeon]
MQGFLRKLFGKRTYSEKEELLKAFLAGKLSIAIPIDIEAIAVLNMFEHCVIKPSEKDKHNSVAYVNKIIETLAELPETIECNIDIGSGFRYPIKINKIDVLKSLIRILEISKNAYLAYINLLWEAIEEYLNNLESKILQLPLVSSDRVKITLPGISLGENVKVSIIEIVSEQTYTAEITKNFVLGSILGLIKAFLEAVCDLSPKLFEIKAREIRDTLRIRVIKIYGLSEKVDGALKCYDEIVASIRNKCPKMSSRIIDILDELIVKAEKYLPDSRQAF